MRKILILTAALALAAPLIGIAEETADSANAAIAAADSARKAAAAVGQEWNTTGRLITAAKKSVEKGDFSSAVKLANEAQAQGEVSQEQAKEQKAIWQSAVLR